jgi:hypothetical protein
MSSDWVAKTATTGQLYYFNEKTKETSFTKPMSSAAASSAGLGSVAAPSVSLPPPPSTDQQQQQQQQEQEEVIVGRRPKIAPAGTVPTDRMPPQPPQPAPKPTALPDWYEHWDPHVNRPFYYNKKTRETSWKLPQEERSPVSPPTSTSEPRKGDQRDGWEVHRCQAFSRDFGKLYYVNNITKATTFNINETPWANAGVQQTPKETLDE